MSYECFKVKFEKLDTPKINKQAQKLLYDREFLRACLEFFGRDGSDNFFLEFFGRDGSDNFFLPSRDEILNEEALFTELEFREAVLKFGDAFGYEETYSVWY